MGGFILTIALFYLLPKDSGTFWQPQVFDIHEFYPQHLTGFIYTVNHGFYYLTDVFQPPTIIHLFATGIMVLIGILLLSACYFCITSLKKETLFIASVCSMAAVLAYLLFINMLVPRYALPLFVAVLLPLYLLLRKLSPKISYSFSLLLIVPGMLSIFQFKNYSFMPVDRKAIVSTTSYLETNHLNYIFSTQGLLQWQLMFYSKEELQARFLYSTDRYPLYVYNVNTVYKNDSSKTAIVGFSQDFNKDAERPFVNDLGNGFSVYPSPSAAVLKMREYEF